jgi:hypothetical protein
VTQQLANADGSNVTNFALDKAQFDTSANPALSEGETGWNADDGTLSVGMPEGNVTLQVGQESLIRVRNESGAGITNGWVAYQTGFSGNKPLIDVHNGGHSPLGIATETIGDSASGYVALRGLVRDVDTSGFLLSAELYASTNGPAITNRPAYPTDAFQVGRVAKVHATEGVILAQTPSCEKSWSELDGQYKHAYASLYIHDGTVAADITNTTDYFIVTTYTNNGVAYGCDVTSSNITVLSAGVYQVDHFMSFSGAGSATYECAFHINGIHNDCGEFERKLGTTGDIGSASGGCIVRLNANDRISVRLKGTSTAIDPTVRQAAFRVIKIGE